MRSHFPALVFENSGETKRSVGSIRTPSQHAHAEDDGSIGDEFLST